MHTGQSVMSALSSYKNHMDNGFQSEAKLVRGLAQRCSKWMLKGKKWSLTYLLSLFGTHGEIQ